jgi:hypothetical protein
MPGQGMERTGMRSWMVLHHSAGGHGDSGEALQPVASEKPRHLDVLGRQAGHR